jgi:hypothetical protein
MRRAGALLLAATLRGTSFLALLIKARSDNGGRGLKHLGYLGVRKPHEGKAKTFLTLGRLVHAIEHCKRSNPVSDGGTSRWSPSC